MIVGTSLPANIYKYINVFMYIPKIKCVKWSSRTISELAQEVFDVYTDPDPDPDPDSDMTTDVQPHRPRPTASRGLFGLSKAF